MQFMNRILLTTLVYLILPLHATFYTDEPIECMDPKLSHWGDVPPAILALENNEFYVLNYVSSVNDLRQETWGKFKRTFTDFWTHAWKDQVPKDLGIKGTVQEFLHGQFDAAFDDLRTNPNACFLSISKVQNIEREHLPERKFGVTDLTQPILGIFARKECLQLAENPDHPHWDTECLFLNLIVLQDPQILEKFHKIFKVAIVNSTNAFVTHECGAFLTALPKGAPLNGVFKELGFTPVLPAPYSVGDLIDDPSVKNTSVLLEKYPPAFYQFLTKSIHYRGICSSDEDEQEPKKPNIPGGDDDDDYNKDRDDTIPTNPSLGGEGNQDGRWVGPFFIHSTSDGDVKVYQLF